jgi:hypothetical protein
LLEDKQVLQTSLEFKKILDSQGSDKAASNHGYHIIYAHILRNRSIPINLLEIGMGTNNVDIVSTMGPNGVPGASLRAFRDFLPYSNIFGADIDSRILFEEDRIQTFQVDQTCLDSMENLGLQLPKELDLIIDDGLHSPYANLASLIFGLPKIKVGGWIVPEDISSSTLPLWQLVA